MKKPQAPAGTDGWGFEFCLTPDNRKVPYQLGFDINDTAQHGRPGF